MQLSDIQIRDPFVVVEHETGTYHLFGSTDPNIWEGRGVGFDCYRSTDLVNWDGPTEAFRPPVDFWSAGRYWAPEVHQHKGAWFMFATFTGDDGRMGTQALRAERVDGPYLPWSAGPLTPPEWVCLDGTLFVDNEGAPWMVFCHEWTQVGDGEICAVRLDDDLRCTRGEPVLLFRGSSAGWSRSLGPMDDLLGSGRIDIYVTDGPFLHRTDDGELLMLWSSMGEKGYAMGVARSATGTVLGPWEQQAEPVWAADGGHGMLFRDLAGTLHLTLHTPNSTPAERARFVTVDDAGGRLRIV